MEDKNQHIDQYFREQLGEYTEQPAPGVWTALEKRLDEKPRRRGFLWVWFTLLFLAAAGTTVFYSLDNTASVNIVSGKANAPVTQTAPVPVKNKPYERNTAGQVEMKHIPTTATISSTGQKPAIKPTVESHTSKTAAAPTSQQTATRPPITTIKTDNEPAKTIAHSAATNTPPDVSVTIPASTSSNEQSQTLPVVQKQAVRNTQATDTLTLMAAAPVPALSTPAREQPAAQKTEIAPAPQVPLPEAAYTVTKETVVVPVKYQEQTKDTIAENTTAVSGPADTPATAGNVIKKRFTSGIKTGYETGTRPYRANSFVLSPYLQYWFHHRIGIMLQPALKYSWSQAALLSYGTYYQTTDTSKVLLPPTNVSGHIPTGNDEYMAYTKTYDSIIIRNRLGAARFWNLDLPVMLTYKIRKNIELYCGMNMSFTRVPRIVTERQSFSATQTDTLRLQHHILGFGLDTLDIDEVFPQKGFQLSDYNATAFDNPTINPFKMGVTFGISYTFKKRFLFDIMYRQTLSDLDYIPNDKVREIYKQPYLRFTLGYKFIK